MTVRNAGNSFRLSEINPATFGHGSSFWIESRPKNHTQNPCLQRRSGSSTFIFSCPSFPFKGAAHSSNAQPEIEENVGTNNRPPDLTACFEFRGERKNLSHATKCAGMPTICRKNLQDPQRSQRLARLAGIQRAPSEPPS